MFNSLEDYENQIKTFGNSNFREIEVSIKKPDLALTQNKGDNQLLHQLKIEDPSIIIIKAYQEKFEAIQTFYIQYDSMKNLVFNWFSLNHSETSMPIRLEDIWQESPESLSQLKKKLNFEENAFSYQQSPIDHHVCYTLNLCGVFDEIKPFYKSDNVLSIIISYCLKYFEVYLDPV